MNRMGFWVATYGDNGLDVEFYATEAEQTAAAEEAQAKHECGELDSYTYGEVRVIE